MLVTKNRGALLQITFIMIISIITIIMMIVMITLMLLVVGSHATNARNNKGTTGKHDTDTNGNRTKSRDRYNAMYNN